ncbi:MAG: HAMP domain-containing protein [Pseudomonadota bacterium]
MKITGLFSIYGAAFFVVTVSLAGLTLWNIDRTRFWDDRIALAQTSYNEHLTLQANIYMLLKQYGDALIIGDRDEGRGERMLSTQIANSINRIREVIAREIELVGEEEFEELELLSRIEKDVERLTSLLGRLGDDGAPMTDEFRMARLVDVLDRQIDVNLSSMIDEALEEELEEVMETEAEAAAFRSTSRQVVIGIVAIAMAILVICGISYWRLVQRPISELREVVDDFGAGRFGRRARVSGGTELRELSRVLNHMAARLAAREATAKEQNELLEARVSERTKELEELLGRIEQSEENRRQLMADISHELRTPLAIIQGEAEVTLRGGATDTRGLF